MNNKNENLDIIEKLSSVYELISFNIKKNPMPSVIQYMSVVENCTEIDKMIKNIKKRIVKNYDNLKFSKEIQLIANYSLLMQYYNFEKNKNQKFRGHSNIEGFVKEVKALKIATKEIDFFKTINFLNKSLILHIKEERLNKKAGEILKRQDPYFNENLGILYINHFEIKIKERKNDTNSLKILKYIFNEKLFGEKISWIDIRNKVFFDEMDECVRKYETAFLSLKQKVLKQTNSEVKDFFEVKTGKDPYIKVNKRFFHNSTDY